MSSGKKSGGGEALPEFTSFYLQQATQEFAEDLDKARTADDFKGDALPMLIKALQQGTALFAPVDQRRVVAKAAAAAAEQPSPDAEDADMADAAPASSRSSSSGASSRGGSSDGDDEK